VIKDKVKDAGVSKTAVGKALASVTGSITNALKKNGKITLVGFGTFSKARLKARKGRNPGTGETIKIKASNAVRFKASKTLKQAIK
jgi:DNA-binding protein HU-beta